MGGLGPQRLGGGGSLRGNPSAPVPWERRVRPAPYVKNSAAAGTASGGCWGAGGASRLRGPGWETGRGPGRRGEGTSGPERMCPSRQSPNLPSPGPWL